MSFAIEQLSLSGLLRVGRIRRGDDRGFFSRFFDAEQFAAMGWPGPVVQMNHTLTGQPGTVRGMHFQSTSHAEWKFVSCLAGEVFDVAVDLRPGSATYGQWAGAILSAENGHSLLIPAGFAHGFQALEEGSELLYLHSAAYAPAAEGGVNALDSELAIAWPLPVTVRSDRDCNLPNLNQQLVS